MSGIVSSLDCFGFDVQRPLYADRSKVPPFSWSHSRLPCETLSYQDEQPTSEIRTIEICCRHV